NWLCSEVAGKKTGHWQERPQCACLQARKKTTPDSRQVSVITRNGPGITARAIVSTTHTETTSVRVAPVLPFADPRHDVSALVHRQSPGCLLGCGQSAPSLREALCWHGQCNGADPCRCASECSVRYRQGPWPDVAHAGKWLCRSGAVRPGWHPSLSAWCGSSK